jgi:hypothetical protein
MNHPYFKKIDRSAFEGWIVIPKEYENDFTCGYPLKPSESRDVTLKYKKKSYKAKLYHVNRKSGNNVYQLRYDIDKDLLKVLKVL